jgi:hypothetical protein
VEAATEAPQILLADRGRNPRRGEQDSPQLALGLLLELLEGADPVADGILGVARHAHHLAHPRFTVPVPESTVPVPVPLGIVPVPVSIVPIPV